ASDVRLASRRPSREASLPGDGHHQGHPRHQPLRGPQAQALGGPRALRLGEDGRAFPAGSPR
ncbi:MAG: hypothetical protein ACK55Z_35235, partial [bacterium]